MISFSFLLLLQTLGTDQFREFFPGEIYFDSDKSFFKSIGNNWASLFQLLHPKFISNTLRARSKNIGGNLEGEGRLLGGLLVMRPQEKGIEYVFKYVQRQ
jgi:hypothetical protein